MEAEQAGRPSKRKMKIARVSIVDQVCASIKQDIADGIWKLGDKIPSEAEFAEMFGVNRLSVRMALQKLNTLGIIDTRVGEGSFVCKFSLKPILSEISIFYEGEDKYHDVQQLRNLLEYECTRLAVQSATEEEKAELAEALKHYNECALALSKDPNTSEVLASAVDADFNFHYKVVKMSHNKLYKDIYYMVQQLVRSHITELISSRNRRRYEAGLPFLGEDDTHTKIYNCIINSDTEALRSVNEEMLGIVPIPGMDVFE